jgi:hypothetical protein
MTDSQRHSSAIPAMTKIDLKHSLSVEVLFTRVITVHIKAHS